MLQHAKRLDALTDQVRKHLPRDLAEKSQVIDYKNNVLVLLTESPVWAARLRFASTGLRKALSSAGSLPVARIRVRVAPEALHPVPPGRQTPPRISAANARLLKQTALGLEDKPPAMALTRLADHVADGSD